jgi:hypothetical protein
MTTKIKAIGDGNDAVMEATTRQIIIFEDTKSNNRYFQDDVHVYMYKFHKDKNTGKYILHTPMKNIVDVLSDDALCDFLKLRCVCEDRFDIFTICAIVVDEHDDSPGYTYLIDLPGTYHWDGISVIEKSVQITLSS